MIHPEASCGRANIITTMDSKSEFPSSNSQKEEAPPSYYNDTTSPKLPTPKYQEPPDSATKYYSHQIQDQLQSLTLQISSIQTQKDLVSHAKDELILQLLTTQIQIYLSDFATSGKEKGTLVLVPADAFEDDKTLPANASSYGSDDFYRVVRLRDKAADEEKNDMFWKDKAMASRLVGYLSPAPDPRKLELPPRKAEPEKKSGGLFGWGRKNSTKSPIEEPRSPVKAEPVQQLGDRVVSLIHYITSLYLRYPYYFLVLSKFLEQVGSLNSECYLSSTGQDILTLPTPAQLDHSKLSKRLSEHFAP